MDAPKQKKKWRKILGIAFTALVSAGAIAGIAVGAYNISNTSKLSSDFNEGRSIQLNFRLFKTDEKGDVILDAHQEPVRLYDKATEEQNIKESAKHLNNILENRGLTNIKVTYGYSNIINNQINKTTSAPIFANNSEPIAVLNAEFEDINGAFNLKDSSDKVNALYNERQIFDALNNTLAYEIEPVKASYKGINYQINKADSQNTQRNPNTTLFAKKTKSNASVNEKPIIPSLNERANSFGYYDTNLMLNNQINIFKNWEGHESNQYASFTLKDNLAYNYFNSYDFGLDKQTYLKLKKDEEANSGSSQTPALLANEQTSGSGGTSSGTEEPQGPPTETQKYQTQYTWFLWKDKQGLIDYLNSLIGIFYFNLYANKVPNDVFLSAANATTANKTTILQNLFPTEDNPKYKRNAVDSNIRKQINNVIESLSDTEKSFIASAVLSVVGTNSVDPLTWTNIQLITEEDLIPILYNFLNDPIFSPVTPVNPNDIKNDNADGVSESVKKGWSFLESTNSDLNSFIGQYYAGTIDYRNFDAYFQSPIKPKEPPKNETNPIPEPFITNQFMLKAEGIDAQSFANLLNDNNYKFPLYVPNTKEFVDNWNHISNEYIQLNNKYNTIQGNQQLEKEFNEEKAKFANTYFVGNNLYSQQYFTPATIATSLLSNKFNPLYVLLIVLGSVIFLVGIFVSIRYRIPGVFAFIISGLVFVLSALLYNVFGYVFSFYSLLALAVGAFLSFIVPSFLFRNIEKEVSEGSTLSAAILKSTRKYWKMSLDTHVMAILASLAFLFFGRAGNINFGAMLIISVFLSFILSGVIYFILLLFYVYVVQFDQNSWFISNRLFTSLNNPERKRWKIYLYNKVNYFNKPSYILVGVLLVIGLAGSIFVAAHGPIFSIDFSSSNILSINNFNQFNLTQQQVIDALGINSINAYVHDNRLVVYTYNNLAIDSVLTTLKQLVNNSVLDNLLTQNVIVSTLTSEYAISIVQNTLKCMGIAIGFCAIWSLLSLNIVSVIPFALVQLMSMLVTIGFTSLVAIPLDLNTIAAFVFIFIISSCFSASLISNIKNSWDRKTLISKENLKELINNIVAKINPNYVWISASILIFAIFSLGFGSVSLIFAFVIVIIGALWLMLANNNFVILSWYSFVLIRNIFNKELLKSKNEKLHVVRDYDSINEQKIVGINC